MKTAMKTLLVFFIFALALPQAEAKFVSSQNDLLAAQATSESTSIEEFLAMTPAKYKQKTGKKLGLKKAIQMRVAQKMLKKQKSPQSISVPKILFILLALAGWGWLVMGLMDDFSSNNWWIGLLLTFLFWIPGVIFSLIKMKEYY